MKEHEEHTAGTAPSVRRVGAILAGVVLSAVVIFSLGVMVGKRVTGNVATVAEPPPALPTETLAPPAYRPPDEPPPAAETATSPDREKLTFFDNLSKEKAAPPELPRKADTTPEKAAAQEEATAATTKGGTPPQQPGEAAPAKTAKETPTPPPPPPPTVQSLAGAGRYYVQVSSTTNRQWADDLVKRLGKKNVSPKSVPVTLQGKQWYRIKVGSFPDRNSAQKAREILKREMKLDGMVVTGD